MVEILLADDNLCDAEMTQRALRMHNLGNKLHWVKDGVEALEFMFCTGAYALRNPDELPKLILLDINMPKMDGIEVLRRIKADERMRLIPAVIMTSSNDERDVLESYRLGVNSYIVKPVDFAVYVKTVADIGMYWTAVNRAPH